MRPIYESSLDDVISAGFHYNESPEDIAGAVKKWRDEHVGYAREDLFQTDPEKYWGGTHALDEDIIATLDGLRLIKMRDRIAELIPDEDRRKEFLGALANTEPGDITGFDKEMAELGKVYDQPEFKHEVRESHLRKVEHEGTHLTSYSIRDKIGEDVEVIMPEFGSRMFTVPSPSEDDVSAAIKGREKTIEDETARAEKWRNRRVASHQYRFKHNIIKEAEQNVEIAKSEIDALNVNGRDFLINESVINEFRKPEWEGIIGNKNLWADLARGTVKSTIATGVGVRRGIAKAYGLFGEPDEEELALTEDMAKAVSGEGAVKQVIPGSTRRTFAGGTFDRGITHGSEAFGAMLPTVVGTAGITRMVTTGTGQSLMKGMGLRAMVPEEMGATAPILSFMPHVYGQSLGEILSYADQVEQRDPDLAKRLRMRADAYGLANMAIEGVSERMWPGENPFLKSAGGFGGWMKRTPLNMFGEGFEEKIAGWWQRGVADPIFMEREVPTSQGEAEEWIAGMMAAGGMSVINLPMTMFIGERPGEGKIPADVRRKVSPGDPFWLAYNDAIKGSENLPEAEKLNKRSEGIGALIEGLEKGKITEDEFKAQLPQLNQQAKWIAIAQKKLDPKSPTLLVQGLKELQKGLQAEATEAEQYPGLKKYFGPGGAAVKVWQEDDVWHAEIFKDGRRSFAQADSEAEIISQLEPLGFENLPEAPAQAPPILDAAEHASGAMKLGRGVDKEFIVGGVPIHVARAPAGHFHIYALDPQSNAVFTEDNVDPDEFSTGVELEDTLRLVMEEIASKQVAKYKKTGTPLVQPEAVPEEEREEEPAGPVTKQDFGDLAKTPLPKVEEAPTEPRDEAGGQGIPGLVGVDPMAGAGTVSAVQPGNPVEMYFDDVGIVVEKSDDGVITVASAQGTPGGQPAWSTDIQPGMYQSHSELVAKVQEAIEKAYAQGMKFNQQQEEEKIKEQLPDQENEAAPTTKEELLSQATALKMGDETVLATEEGWWVKAEKKDTSAGPMITISSGLDGRMWAYSKNFEAPPEKSADELILEMEPVVVQAMNMAESLAITKGMEMGPAEIGETATQFVPGDTGVYDMGEFFTKVKVHENGNYIVTSIKAGESAPFAETTIQPVHWSSPQDLMNEITGTVEHHLSAYPIYKKFLPKGALPYHPTKPIPGIDPPAIAAAALTAWEQDPSKATQFFYEFIKGPIKVQVAFDQEQGGAKSVRVIHVPENLTLATRGVEFTMPTLIANVSFAVDYAMYQAQVYAQDNGISLETLPITVAGSDLKDTTDNIAVQFVAQSVKSVHFPLNIPNIHLNIDLSEINSNEVDVIVWDTSLSQAWSKKHQAEIWTDDLPKTQQSFLGAAKVAIKEANAELKKYEATGSEVPSFTPDKVEVELPNGETIEMQPINKPLAIGFHALSDKLKPAGGVETDATFSVAYDLIEHADGTATFGLHPGKMIYYMPNGDEVIWQYDDQTPAEEIVSKVQGGYEDWKQAWGIYTGRISVTEAAESTEKERAEAVEETAQPQLDRTGTMTKSDLIDGEAFSGNISDHDAGIYFPTKPNNGGWKGEELKINGPAQTQVVMTPVNPKFHRYSKRNWIDMKVKATGEPESEPILEGKNYAAGIIIEMPDGKIAVVHPHGNFGGVHVGIPKGGVNKSAGMTYAQGAVKETFEETGMMPDPLHLQFLGDYEASTSVVRVYVARYQHGVPGDIQPMEGKDFGETDHVILTHPILAYQMALESNKSPMHAKVLEDYLQLKQGLPLKNSQHNPAGQAKKIKELGAQHGWPQDALPKDTYWTQIEAGLKTINFHIVQKDNKPNEETLAKTYAMNTDLLKKANLAVKLDDPQEQEMAMQYLHVLTLIKEKEMEMKEAGPVAEGEEISIDHIPMQFQYMGYQVPKAQVPNKDFKFSTTGAPWKHKTQAATYSNKKEKWPKTLQKKEAEVVPYDPFKHKHAKGETFDGGWVVEFKDPGPSFDVSVAADAPAQTETGKDQWGQSKDQKGNVFGWAGKDDGWSPTLSYADPEYKAPAGDAVYTPPKDLPDAPQLTQIKSLKGSTGAVSGKVRGKIYKRKTAGKSKAGHLLNEFHADMMYRAVGLNTPPSKLYQEGDNIHMVTGWVQGGKDLKLAWKGASPAQKKKIKKEIQKGFVMDALMGNWDIIGLDQDNIMVTPDGQVWRVDNGGALIYRAQGGLKHNYEWLGAAVILELDTMRWGKINPQSAKFYVDISNDDLRKSMEMVLNNEAKLLAVTPEPLQEMMKMRLAYLKDYHKRLQMEKEGKQKLKDPEYVAAAEKEWKEKKLKSKYLKDWAFSLGDPDPQFWNYEQDQPWVIHHGNTKGSQYPKMPGQDISFPTWVTSWKTPAYWVSRDFKFWKGHQDMHVVLRIPKGRVFQPKNPTHVGAIEKEILRMGYPSAKAKSIAKKINTYSWGAAEGQSWSTEDRGMYITALRNLGFIAGQLTETGSQHNYQVFDPWAAKCIASTMGNKKSYANTGTFTGMADSFNFPEVSQPAPEQEVFDAVGAFAMHNATRPDGVVNFLPQSTSPQHLADRIGVAKIVGEKPKKRRQIYFDVAKALGLNIKTGVKPKGAAAAYYPQNAVLAVRYQNDARRTAHEIGHAVTHLGDLYGPIFGQNTYDAELQPFWATIGDPTMNEHVKRIEGIAEFMRAWLLNPEEAEVLAPTFTNYMKNQLGDQVITDLQGFGKDLRRLEGATYKEKVQSQVLAQWEKEHPIHSVRHWFSRYDPANPYAFKLTLGDALSNYFLDNVKYLVAAFEYAKAEKGIGKDELLPEDDAVLLARLFSGNVGRIEDIYLHGMVNADNERVTEGIDSIITHLDTRDMDGLKSELYDLYGFMLSERTIELAGRFGKESGVSGIGVIEENDVEVAQGYLAEMESEDPEKLDRMKQAAAAYRKFADSVLRYAVDKGRMTRSAYESIKRNNLHYVAMNRIIEMDPGEAFSIANLTQGGIGKTSKLLHTIHGSSRTLDDPLTILLQNTARIVSEADRNEVMQAFTGMLRSNTGIMGEVQHLGSVGFELPPKALAPKGRHVFTVFEAGEPRRWVMQQDIERSLLGWMSPEAPQRGLGIFRASARLLRNGIVYMPPFAVRNIIRDTQHRIQVSRSGLKNGLLETARRPEFGISELRIWGASMSGPYLQTKTNFAKAQLVAMRDMVDKGNIILNAGKFVDGYANVIQSAEYFNRIKEFNAAYKHARDKLGYSDKNAKLWAAGQSRELIDYAVGGVFTKSISQYVPFTNAATQALRRTMIAGKEDPMGFATRAVMLAVVPSLLTRMLANLLGYDDEYEELPAYQRDLFWNFKAEWMPGEFNWISIPKNYEVGALASGAERLFSWALYEEEEAYKGWMNSVLRQVLVIDETSLGGIGLRGMAQTFYNFDPFRDRNIINPFEVQTELAATNTHGERIRKTGRASRMGKGIQWFAENAGLSDTWMGKKFMDARAIDYIMEAQLGYAGKITVALSDIGRTDRPGKGPFEFGATLTGLARRDPVYSAKNVQRAFSEAKSIGLSANSTVLRPLKNALQDYYDASTSEDQARLKAKVYEKAARTLQVIERRREIKRRRPTPSVFGE